MSVEERYVFRNVFNELYCLLSAASSNSTPATEARLTRYYIQCHLGNNGTMAYTHTPIHITDL